MFRDEAARRDFEKQLRHFEHTLLHGEEFHSPLGTAERAAVEHELDVVELGRRVIAEIRRRAALGLL